MIKDFRQILNRRLISGLLWAIAPIGGGVLLNSHDMTLTGIGWAVLVIVQRLQSGAALKQFEEKRGGIGFKLSSIPKPPIGAIARYAVQTLPLPRPSSAPTPSANADAASS